MLVVVQLISSVQLFANHGLQHARLPCPSLSPKVCSNSCPLCQWCHPTISFSVSPFSSCPQSFSITVFSHESVLHIRWPKYWSFSFSVSPSNDYSGFTPSGLTDLFSLLTKGLSRALKHQFESINSSALSLIYGPTLTSVHDYWKSYGFDYMALCRQNDVSTF